MSFYKFFSLLCCILFTEIPCVAQAGFGEIENKRVNMACIGEDSSPIEPFWADPKSIVSSWPTQENKEVYRWVLTAQNALRESFEKESGWKHDSVVSSFFILVDSAGAIKDPIYQGVGPRKAYFDKAFKRSRLLSKLPAYMHDRRLKLKFEYPQITVEVDYHDPVEDRQFFERLKCRAKNEL